MLELNFSILSSFLKNKTNSKKEYLKSLYRSSVRDFSFYIDKDYTLLRIFEGWMDYITSGAESEVGDLQKPFYRRLRYPDNYKVSSMYISKFEKNLDQALTYQFINAFPKSITPVPVTYGTADLLKVSVSFNYDRYIVNRKRRQPSILSSIFNIFQSSESSTEKYNSNKPETVDT